MSDLRFGTYVSHSKEALENANFDIQREDRERRAEELGKLVMEKKGWREEEQDGIIYSSQDLYIFTAKELRAFVELKGGRIV